MKMQMGGVNALQFGTFFLWFLSSLTNSAMVPHRIVLSFDSIPDFCMPFSLPMVAVGVLIFGRSKREETEQVHEAETYRSMFENVPVGVYRMTPAGKVLEANRKFVELLGYQNIEELKSANVNDLYVSKSDRMAFLDKLRTAELNGEFQMRRKDGRTIWVHDYPKATVSMNGYVTHLDGMAVETQEIDAITRDLNEDKRLDIKRMRAQFISSVTHELRTPLVSIKGYLDYVLAKNDGSVSGAIRPSLEVIKRNTDRLFNLVNDLLDVQRIESGKLALKLETFDFRQILTHCTEEMLPIFNQKSQKITVDAPAGSLDLRGDRLRLTEILTNMLNNATKFTPDGGQVSVRVEQDSEFLRVFVHDTGIGIDKADLERVFEPFSAIPKPTYIKGTGLGMSLAKRLIEAHGGRIWVDSPGKGEGTTFAFELPRRLTVGDV